MQQTEDFVFYNGKKLRKGYTTGSCSTAAATAAAIKLFTGEELSEVKIQLPNETSLMIPIESIIARDDCVVAFVKKDGGDDVDATDGMLIGVEVKRRSKDQQIIIDGGQGIGRVTQVGLPTAVGEAAINPVPRKMIAQAVRQVIGEEQGALVTVFAPDGEKIAKQTMNSRLGIIGGISILGTSGIVTPMSEEGWKQAISIELEMKRKQGYRKIILCPGNYGEDFAVNELKLSPDYIVSMSNFVGYVLKEVQRLAFEEILLVGHLGKLVKVAGGIFSTHSKDADARMEILIANLALMGAPLSLLQAIEKCTTTEAATDLIEEANYQGVYQILADKIQQRSHQMLKYRDFLPQIDVVLFSSTKGYLAATKTVATLKEAFQ
ncbi:cobalt-precorrin-5B (C1)-methyltransferase [Enterococcus sp. PF1-24]|uniref:cobalt-precorrin-5B (C(1))-methyltransferase CbiD n=1 Tax=unclassified Enterococcus TaxID=2608891 RepID=UPI0024739AFA|nr:MULTISPECIES: cobalt-precorrin-5B (C(1))-methyltransferase CbiD [unclassified Enterococcus]MDH6363386.1 cobalt-precorrin-5B (C1)-methyltransferase [Enterococcus sp. PFB1-1]MDH6400313.1 cobalt-precorrin-5B (C1)-methyltransferase [Enterococcus sp. PF1-24]